MKKINVTNMVNHAVTVSMPEINFKRTWSKQGMTIGVDEEKLKELVYDPGFNYMIEQGILYIEDMDEKKELGIEPEDATEPQNVIVLSEKEQRKYMISLTIQQFKENVSKLKLEQVRALADYAIKNRLGDIDKCEFLKERCGIDVIKAIQLGDFS